MAQSNLMTSTSFVKQALMYFGIFVVIVLLVQGCIFIFNISFQNNTGINPNLVTENQKYGELNPPTLTSLTVANPSGIEFSVNNDLPELPIEFVNIYQITEPGESFVSRDIAEGIATELEFESRAELETEFLIWEERNKIFEFNRSSYSFNYSNTAVNVPTLEDGVETRFSTDPQILENQAVSLINSLRIPLTNLNTDQLEIDLLRTTFDGSLESVQTINRADFIKIRVYRTNQIIPEIAFTETNNQSSSNNTIIDSKYNLTDRNARVILQDVFSAPLEILLTNDGGSFEPEFISSINHLGWEYTEVEDPGIYKIISPAQAWENVQAGEGALKLLLENGRGEYQAGLRNNQDLLSLTANYEQVELAYLEPENWSESENEYLYPTYIFKGRARLANSPGIDNAEFIVYTDALVSIN